MLNITAQKGYYMVNNNMTALRFECQSGCTSCCEQQGFVYLTVDDLNRIAEYVGMTARDFERRYVYRTRHLLRLRVPREQQCHFLRDGGCSIHAVKPVQCRKFPFWPELVNSTREWKKTAAWCPGIGKGELVQIETARERSEEMKTAYPSLYRS
jgi:Fe-S-cluster containining protein